MNTHIYDLGSSHYEAFSDLIPKDLLQDEKILYLCALDDRDYASGILAYQLTPEAVELLYINIYEELADEGIEEKLLEALLERVDASGYYHYVTSFFPSRKSYHYLRKVLEGSDEFMVTDSDYVYYLKPEDRTRFKYYQRIKDLTGNVVLFAETDPRTRRKFYQYITAENIDYTGGEDEPYLENILSTCILDENDEISSCIFFKKKSKKELELSYMMTKAGHEKDIGVLLADAIRKVEEKYTEATITFNTVSDKSKKLVANMFGDSLKRETIYMAIRL